MKITKKVRAAREVRCSYDVVLKDGDVYREDDSNDIVEVHSRPIIKKVASPEEAAALILEFINKNALSSSQYTGGIVLKDDKPVYYVSYNGKLNDFNDFVNEWGAGIVKNSRVLESLGYTLEQTDDDSIQAAESFFNNWQKKYDKDLQEGYYELETLDGRAVINDIDNDGDWGYEAIVMNNSSDIIDRDCFYGQGSRESAMKFCEDALGTGIEGCNDVTASDEWYVVNVDLDKKDAEWWAEQEKKRIAREIADEEDAYDLEHDEGIYSCDEVQASSTRDRISDLEQSIRNLEKKIADERAAGADEEIIIDDQILLSELKDELNFAWQDDEAEYNYALQQQEFNPDGSLKGYDDYDITSSTDILSVSPELIRYLENLAYEDARDDELYGTALSSLQEFKQVLEEGEWPVSQLSENDLKELFKYYLDALTNAKQEINSSTDVTAAKIVPNKQIQVGMEWNQDWHRFLVQSISSDRKTCKITEDWLSEDTGEPVHKEYLYNIEDDGEHGEYVWEDEYREYAKPGQDDYSWWARKYATGADNYPWQEALAQEEAAAQGDEEFIPFTHYVLYNKYENLTYGDYNSAEEAAQARDEMGMDPGEWRVVETDWDEHS